MSQPSGLNGMNNRRTGQNAIIRARLSVKLYVHFLSCFLHTHIVLRRMVRKITVLKTSGFLFTEKH